MGVKVESDAPAKISRAVIEAARKRRQEGVRRIIRDTSCPGLALVMSPSSEIWRFDWRPRGLDGRGRRWPTQSLTIGTPASHTPDAARAEAGRLRGEAKSGADLGAERKARIREQSLARGRTVEALTLLYEQDLPRRPKLRGTGTLGPESLKKELAHLRLAVKAMGVADRPVIEIASADLAKLLMERANQPATARQHFGAFSRFLDWSCEMGHIPINPCLRIPKNRRPRAVPSRPVCPSVTELAAIWIGADVLPSAERDVVRWLIAVPCRLREATRLDWRHVDWREQRINLPAGMMKTGEPHRVHIPAFALGVLRARHRAAGSPDVGLVFPAARSGKPIEATTKIKAQVSAAAGVSGWTLHDFRRGFASGAVDLGVAEPVADAILSHRQSATRAGVLGVYQKSSRWPEQVAAMNAWGAVLQSAIIGFASIG